MRKQHHVYTIAPILRARRTQFAPALSSTPSYSTSPSPPPPPSPSTAATNAQHNSLPTFLAHARRTSLSSTSTTYIGTHYEYTVLQSLRRLGFSLERTGGRGDKGVDLVGWWYVPDADAGRASIPEDEAGCRSEDSTGGEKLRGQWTKALVQCKALTTSSASASPSPTTSTPTIAIPATRKAGPSLIRELEGTFAALPSYSHHTSPPPPSPLTSPSSPSSPSSSPFKTETIAILTTPTSATKGVRDALSRSRSPMAFLKISPVGRVEQMVWNRAAGDGVCEGFEGVGVRHLECEGESGGEDMGREVVLLVRGGGVWDFSGASRGDGGDGGKGNGEDERAAVG